MSDAQQTIAAVLAVHWWFSSRDGETGCNCNWRDGVDMTREQWAAHVAAEVDAALGTLTREWGVHRGGTSFQPTPRDSREWCRNRAEFLNDRYGPDSATVVDRWVSGWTPQDGE